MTKFELTYNPFTRERTFLADGRPDTLPNCWDDNCRKELAEWCGSFFEALREKFADSEMEVTFKGIRRDWESLVDAKEAYCKENPSDRISLIDGGCVNAKAKIGELRSLFERMQDETPFQELRSQELTDLFNRAMSSEFEMAVVATVSSGKSTLINAMLGRELLPARNEATTATLAKIHDVDDMKDFKGTSYDANGKELASCDPLTLDNVDTLNKDPKTSVIEIFGDVPGVESTDIQLVLTDTPGPNNSRTGDHKAHTYALITADYKPMILYVLNGTQPETNDDDRLLDDVATAMMSGGRQSQERFLFVLNKADEFDPDKGEGPKQKIEKAKEYLAKHGIKGARIFPTAARLAKVIRQHLNNQPLTETEVDDILPKYKSFIKREWKHFSDFALRPTDAPLLSAETRGVLEAKLSDAQETGDKYREALIYTGVPSIELAISEYLVKYALPAKLAEGVYSFKDKIDSLGVEAVETQRLAGNRDAVAKLRENLERCEAALQNGKKADELRAKIDALSIRTVVEEQFERVRSKFGLAIAKLTRGMQNRRMDSSEAATKVRSLEAVLSDKCREFCIDVQKALNKAFSDQTQKILNLYRDYLEKFMGALPYSMPSTAILGGVGEIRLDVTLDEYSRQEQVKVGSHREGGGTGAVVGGIAGLGSALLLGGPFSWLVAAGAAVLGSAIGSECSGHEVDDYQTLTYVDLSKWLDESFKPRIDSFAEATRKSAMGWATQEEARFKRFLKEKLSNVNEVVKKKLAEKRKSIASQEALEKTIAENERRLAWLKDFKNDLDKVLSI